MKKENQWNEIYEQNKAYTYYDIFKPHEDMQKIAEYFKKNKVSKILDLGCGAGRNLLYLAKQGFEIYGLDYASEGINLIKKQLKEHGLETKLTTSSFYKKLPYQDNYFDAIISVQSIQHGTNKQITHTIKEMERVLKNKGLIFITVSGRISQGKVRYCLVKTAKKIAEHTYTPTIGSEAGLTHFIYNKKLIKQHFKNFKKIYLWKDSKDYYCFLAQKNY